MGIRASWEIRYGIVVKTGITSTATFASGNGIGLKSNYFGLLLTNNPSFEAGKSIVDTPKSFGRAQRVGGTGGEYQAEREAPSVTLEMEADRYCMALFGWLLFQKGASESSGASPYAKTYVPYRSGTGTGEATNAAEPEIYAVLLKDFSGDTSTAAEHHVILGAICKSMKIAGSEGGAITLSAEMVGADFTNTFTESSLVLTPTDLAPLLFKDLTFTVGGVTNLIGSFDITITNNAAPKSYNSGTISNYVLGKVIVTGSVSMPWSDANAAGMIDAYLSQTPQTLVFKWGTASSTLVQLTIPARITNAPLDASGEELMVSVSFEGVWYSADYPSVTMVVEDSVLRSIPA